MNTQIGEISRYIIVGLINTTEGLLLIYLCMALGIEDVVANFIGYIPGFILSFFLNGRWTFRRSKLSCLEFGRFGLVVLVAYLINISVMLTTRDVLGWGSHLGQISGVVTYTLASFIGMKFIAFSPALNKLTEV